MELIAKIFASNPPTILIVLGAFLRILGDPVGLSLIGVGVILQIIWMYLKFR